jgi:hypothetical protein
MGNSTSSISKIEEQFATKKKQLLGNAMEAQIKQNKTMISSLDHAMEFFSPEVIDQLSKLPSATVIDLAKYYNDFLLEFKDKVTGIAEEIIKASQPIDEMTSPEAVLRSLSSPMRNDVKQHIKQQNDEMRRQKAQQKAVDYVNAGEQAITDRQTVLNKLQENVGQIRQDVKLNGEGVDLGLAASTVEQAGQVARSAQQQVRKAATAGQLKTSIKQAQAAADTAQEVVKAVSPVIDASVIAPMAHEATQLQRGVQRLQQKQEI